MIQPLFRKLFGESAKDVRQLKRKVTLGSGTTRALKISSKESMISADYYSALVEAPRR